MKKAIIMYEVAIIGETVQRESGKREEGKKRKITYV